MPGAGEALILLVILAVPLLGFAGLQGWGVWLVRRGAAPGWVVWVLPALLVLSSLVAVVELGLMFRAVAGVAADQKRAVLSKSIAGIMSVASVGCLPLPFIWIGCLAWFTARRARS